MEVNSINQPKNKQITQLQDPCNKVQVQKQQLGNALNGSYKVNANGRIDEYFSQGQKPDCAFLADIIGISHKKWASDALAKNIVPDGKGGFNITIGRGWRKSEKINISYDEIVAARKIDPCNLESPQRNNYSIGDDDVLILELACEKYLKNNGMLASLDVYLSTSFNFSYYNIYSGLTNNYVADMSRSDRFSPENCSKFLDMLETNWDNYIVTCGFYTSKSCKNPFSNNKPPFIKSDMDIPNYSVLSKHAYSLHTIEREGNKRVLVLINPHDSNSRIRVPEEDFINNCHHMKVYMKEANEELDRTLRNSTEFSLAVGEERAREESSHIEKVRNTLTDDKSMVKEYAENIYNDFKDALANTENQEEKVKIINDYLEYMYKCTPEILKDNLYDMSEQLITMLDKMESGWGHGKKKKELIQPIVDKVAYIAKKNGKSQEEVDSFVSACTKELDALFYTDEKVIISQIQSILQKNN